MGLDSRLTFIAPLSKERLARYEGMNRKNIPMWGYDEEEINNPKFDFVRHMYQPIKVICTKTDYDKLRNHLGIPAMARLWGFGPGYVDFRWKDGAEERSERFYENVFNDEWNIDYEDTLYFADDTEEVYRWMRNDRQDAIWELFNIEHPDEWDEYLGRNIQGYGKFYPVTQLDKMYELDPVFRDEFDGRIGNVFYSSDW